jgi:hypothetical protein
MNIKKESGAFVGLIFLLLGALFGMIIMAFIFGNLSPTIDNIFDPTGHTVVNESGGFINSSGYTVVDADQDGFSSFVVNEIRNFTGQVITSPNYTYTQAGVITSAGAENWTSVFVDYDYDSDSSQKKIADNVNNNSLSAIETYSEQSDTQFNVAAIAIVLLILLALFAIFWKFFMGEKRSSSRGGGSATQAQFGTDV